MKNILITGANSYVGMAVEKWLLQNPTDYKITTLDMLDKNWESKDFSQFNVVFHVAGIAHADISKVTEETKQLYYKVNTDLACTVANKAKNEGVKQFIFMSSMIIFSGCKETHITKSTIPNPFNFYGDSKWQADQKIRTLEDSNFKVVTLRPPMIYGKNSKGNFPQLIKFATKLPFFPKVKNKRSMLYINNLCQFIKLMIDNEESGIFYPQNDEYSNTSDLVKQLAKLNNHKILIIPGFGWLIKLISHIPCKVGRLCKKAFGDSLYEMDMSTYKQDYIVAKLQTSLKESIQL